LGEAFRASLRLIRAYRFLWYPIPRFYWVLNASPAGLSRPRVEMKMEYPLRDPDRQGQLYIAAGLGFELGL